MQAISATGLCYKSNWTAYPVSDSGYVEKKFPTGVKFISFPYPGSRLIVTKPPPWIKKTCLHFEH